jgi:hypothetical protein
MALRSLSVNPSRRQVSKDKFYPGTLSFLRSWREVEQFVKRRVDGNNIVPRVNGTRRVVGAA